MSKYIRIALIQEAWEDVSRRAAGADARKFKEAQGHLDILNKFNDVVEWDNIESSPSIHLMQQERLAVQAAIQHAKERGAKSIVIADAPTVMLTEGHDVRATPDEVEYEPALGEPLRVGWLRGATFSHKEYGWENAQIHSEIQSVRTGDADPDFESGEGFAMRLELDGTYRYFPFGS